jgi:Pyruvate/2-oxoacid:ferredoxin oxidoreductase gamma subunit
MDPVVAQHFVLEELTKAFPLGVIRDRTKEAPVRPSPQPPPELAEIPRLLGLTRDGSTELASGANAAPLDLAIKVAGFGGQGVLLLGEVLAEAGLAASLQVSWLPSYGPEMRSGTSNCHVRIATQPIPSPLVSRPNVLLAMNEPSLRKFIPTVEPHGIVLYNGAACPADCVRADVTVIAAPFAEMADALGGARAANIAMLGALLEAASLPFEGQIPAVLRRLVRSPKWLEIDLAALARGRQAAKEEVAR